MKKTFCHISILLTLFILPTEAQNNETTFCYWIGFADKSASQYSINKPENFLSEQTLNRRSAFNIPIDQLDMPVNDTYIEKLKSVGLNIQGSSKWFNGAVVYTQDSNLIYDTWDFDFIIERKLIGMFSSAFKSSRNKFDIKDDSIGIQDGFSQINLENGFYLHNNGFKGKGMTIAILDAGFENVNFLQAFDSIRNREGILATRDFSTYPIDIYSTHYHGMNVLSLIAGNVPNTLIGSAPDADVLLLRTEVAHYEQPIEEYNWVMAAEYADSLGVDIFSTSLGYSFFDYPFKSYSYFNMDGKTSIIARASTIASRKGILVVNSAGNEGNEPWKYITTPGDADGILTIGATDYLGNPASFSSYGPSFDGRIKPDIAGMGRNVLVQMSNGTIDKSSGTSFSCPIISGLSACLWQAFPEYNNHTILSAIVESSSLYSSPTNNLGYGIPDFEKAYTLLKFKSRKQMSVVYPNVFSAYIDLELLSYKTDFVDIKIYNLQGNLLFENRIQTKEFINTYRINTDNLSPGIYILNIQTKEFKESHKMIKAQ